MTQRTNQIDQAARWLAFAGGGTADGGVRVLGDRLADGTREHRIRRACRRAAPPLFVLAVLVASAACSSGGAAPAPTTTVTVAPAPPTTVCATQAPPSYAPVAGIDPYAAIGARQHPGPAMSTTPLPDQPVSRDVQVTPDPDQLAAARQPDGVPATLDSTIAPLPTAPPETAPPGECWQSTDGSDGP